MRRCIVRLEPHLRRQIGQPISTGPSPPFVSSPAGPFAPPIPLTGLSLSEPPSAAFATAALPPSDAASGAASPPAPGYGRSWGAPGFHAPGRFPPSAPIQQPVAASAGQSPPLTQHEAQRPDGASPPHPLPLTAPPAPSVPPASAPTGLSPAALSRMLVAYERAGRDADVARVLADARAGGVALDSGAQEAAIRSVARRRDLGEADRMLGEARAAGFVLSAPTWNGLVEMYAEMGEIERMEDAAAQAARAAAQTATPAAHAAPAAPAPAAGGPAATWSPPPPPPPPLAAAPPPPSAPAAAAVGSESSGSSEQLSEREREEMRLRMKLRRRAADADSHADLAAPLVAAPLASLDAAAAAPSSPAAATTPSPPSPPFPPSPPPPRFAPPPPPGVPPAAAPTAPHAPHPPPSPPLFSPRSPFPAPPPLTSPSAPAPRMRPGVSAAAPVDAPSDTSAPAAADVAAADVGAAAPSAGLGRGGLMPAGRGAGLVRLGGPAAGAGRGRLSFERQMEGWRGAEGARERGREGGMELGREGSREGEKERVIERGREGEREEQKQGQGGVGGVEVGRGAAVDIPPQQHPPPLNLSREDATERALGILTAAMAKARDSSRASSRRDAVNQFAAEALGSVMSRRRLGAGPGGPGGGGPGGGGRGGREEGRRMGGAGAGGQRRGGMREGEQRRGMRDGGQRGGGMGMGMGLVMDRQTEGQGGQQRPRMGGGGRRGRGELVTGESVVQRFIEESAWSEEDERQVGEFLDFLEAADVANAALHQRFMVDFEPEYITPDDFSPLNPLLAEEEQQLQAGEGPSLEEVMVAAKAELMALTGMQSEEEFQSALQSCLSRADELETLVELYAGPQRMTALQENKALQEAAEKLPPSVSPQAVAFTKRALLTLQPFSHGGCFFRLLLSTSSFMWASLLCPSLAACLPLWQNNPSWTFAQKQKMIGNIVRGFSASA
ncbi:unnamed protein product [Closterium sp. Naga37s-1]|nr:unnamed protein product [Closterium sp. Naga37s-1]